jgi:hypothetical protein
MNSELERAWKKHFPVGTEENLEKLVRIAGLQPIFEPIASKI